MEWIGYILVPIRFVIEAVLVGWHWLFTSLGMSADSGLAWVLAILGVVIFVRIAIFPLFVKQILNQRKMMELAPEIKKIQTRYKGKRDQLSREAMSRETMALYKKHGTTPVSGCLPMLVQMPIFFSLFWTLSDVRVWSEEGIGGWTSRLDWFPQLLSADLVREFNDASLFGIAPLSMTLTDHFNIGAASTPAIVMLIILVGLMITTQFITQLQIVSKNLSPEAKTGQAYQMQKIMLWVIPFAMIFSGVFFPLGVVTYWFFNNLWTMAQQFYVIREMPTPGSEAAKAREERLAAKGKAVNSQGKVVSMAEYEREQAELLRQRELEKQTQAKRVQPKSAKRAKKTQQRKPNQGGQKPQSGSGGGSDAKDDQKGDG